LIQASRFWESV